jgi:hypothetical protein
LLLQLPHLFFHKNNAFFRENKSVLQAELKATLPTSTAVQNLKIAFAIAAGLILGLLTGFLMLYILPQIFT